MSVGIDISILFSYLRSTSGVALSYRGFSRLISSNGFTIITSKGCLCLENFSFYKSLDCPWMGKGDLNFNRLCNLHVDPFTIDSPISEWTQSFISLVSQPRKTVELNFWLIKTKEILKNHALKQGDLKLFEKFHIFTKEALSILMNQDNFYNIMNILLEKDALISMTIEFKDSFFCPYLLPYLPAADQFVHLFYFYVDCDFIKCIRRVLYSLPFFETQEKLTFAHDFVSLPYGGAYLQISQSYPGSTLVEVCCGDEENVSLLAECGVFLYSVMKNIKSSPKITIPYKYGSEKPNCDAEEFFNHPLNQKCEELNGGIYWEKIHQRYQWKMSHRNFWKNLDKT